jgi:hypothetical protein
MAMKIAGKLLYIITDRRSFAAGGVRQALPD